MTTTWEGGCACGSVRYRLLKPPMFVHCCHCTLCQRQVGSAFVVNGLIESAHLEVLAGAPEPVSMPTESGRTHDIYRCQRCRVAVWSDYGGRPFLRFVRVTTLDTPAAFPPDVHIFTRSKLPWVVLPPGARAFDVYYELEREWPAESLARRAAMFASASAS